MGDIQFNEIIGQTIVDQGLQSPNELTLDFSYSLLLSKNFSSSVAARFIYSDLKLSTDVDPSSASTVGFDISAFYKSEKFQFFGKSSIFRTGINISNIGPRLKYDEGGQKDFIPTNLRIGSGLDIIIDDSNILGINIEFSKLMVPSPIAFYDENNNLYYRQPDISFFKGMLESFGDAPGGTKEELKEITWAIGTEYKFSENFALRTGYYFDKTGKISNPTFGVGFRFSNYGFDFGYTSGAVGHPLTNTMRFSMNMQF